MKAANGEDFQSDFAKTILFWKASYLDNCLFDVLKKAALVNISTACEAISCNKVY